MKDPLISLREVSYWRNRKAILQGISLDLHAGEIVTIIGPNGAGKTSLVKLILSLEAPSSGHIQRKPSLKTGYMPQRFPVDQNLPITVIGFLKLSGAAENRCQQTLEEVGVGELHATQLSTVSGGELQRILLARAILNKPDLLVLDEPAQGVDIGGQNQLYQLINQIRDRLNCGIILVSHDLHLVMANSDSVVCLNHHICCQGSPEAVSNNPEYHALFGDQIAPNLAIYTHDHDHEHNLHGDPLGTGEDCHHGQCHHD